MRSAARVSRIWRPGANLDALRRRALLLDAARGFFRARGVLEVETPILAAHTVTDVHIESLRLDPAQGARWLQTSPEYAMKRLLAAGSGDIFQISRVFRAGECSRLHNPEFTLVEWYRLGMELEAIMAETAALAAALLEAGGGRSAGFEAVSYADAFQRELGLDPLGASTDTVAILARTHGLAASSIAAASREELLDFLLAARIAPALGRGALTCLHHFPAAQAALARLDPRDPRTALRFELFAEGIELANGYVELADAAEQRRRFEQDLVERQRRGAAQPQIDERLLAAIESGLPPCAGVALGFDRVAMLALGASAIEEVIAYGWNRA